METKRCISLVITGILCGCAGQEPFTTTDITFCVSEPFDRSYNQMLDAVYTQGDIAWIYMEVFKFSYIKEDLLYTAYFDTALNVYDEKGITCHEGTRSQRIPFQKEPVYAWFSFWIDTIKLKEGVYTVKITITDTISGETVVTEGMFTVEDKY